jgi:hypothetical protein
MSGGLRWFHITLSTESCHAVLESPSFFKTEKLVQTHKWTLEENIYVHVIFWCGPPAYGVV